MFSRCYLGRDSVVHMSFSGDFGGREKVAAWLCRAISSEGVSCRLFMVLEERAGKDRNANLIHALGDSLDFYTMFKTDSRFSISLAIDLAKALSSVRATVLHCHCYKSLFYALLLKFFGRFSGVVVYTLHGIELPSGIGPSFIRGFQSLGLRYSDGVIGCSREVLARSLSKGWRGRKKAIINAISLPPGGYEAVSMRKSELRDAACRRFGLNPLRPLVLNIGRLCPQKNFSLFLRLIQCFMDKGPEIPATNFLIVGDGELRDELESEAQRLGVRDKVCFVGFVTDMDALYVGADLVVQTSTWEGTPMCLLEARSYGLPVVAPAVGGNVDVVRDGIDGALYSAGDLDQLSRKTAAYLCDPELRQAHGRLAFEHTGREFDPAHWARLHLQFYDEMTQLSGKEAG